MPFPVKLQIVDLLNLIQRKLGADFFVILALGFSSFVEAPRLTLNTSLASSRSFWLGGSETLLVGTKAADVAQPETGLHSRYNGVPSGRIAACTFVVRYNTGVAPCVRNRKSPDSSMRSCISS